MDAALQLVERTGERWIEAEVGGYAPTRILLDEAYDGVRHVGILQSGDLISGQLDVHRGQRIVEMVELSRADDRRGDHRLCQQPGERDLSARDATGFGNHGHPIDCGPPLRF